MDKIIKVNFKDGWNTQFDNSLSQWDYGQVLQIEGLTLPDGNIEVHFSLTENNGNASVSIGMAKENVITVNIPDFILAKENVFQPSYSAWAWIYLTDEESGQTIRKIEFTIESRSKPTTNVPEANKDPFLQEVRQVMAETKEIAQSVRDDADNGKFGGGTANTVDSELSEESTNPVQNQAVAKEINALKDKDKALEDQLAELEVYKANAIITTHSGTTILTTDSANVPPLNIIPYGKSSQKTYEGNQLVDFDSYIGTTESFLRTDNFKLVAGTMTFSILLDAQYSGAVMAFKNSDLEDILQVSAANTSTFELTEEQIDSVAWVYVYVYEELAGSKILSIMLNSGDTVLPYEPYTGNAPSPSMAYPQPIESLENVEVKVLGKNQLDESTISVGTGGYEYHKNTPHLLKGGQTYTIKTYGYSVVPTAVILYANGEDYKVVYGNDTLTFTADEDVLVTYRLWWDTESNVPPMEDVHTQLEFGEVATEYEPYTEQTFTALTPNGLNGLQSTEKSTTTYIDSSGKHIYSDEIDFKKRQRVQRIFSETITDFSTAGIFDSVEGVTEGHVKITHNKMLNTKPLCDKFINHWTGYFARFDIGGDIAYFTIEGEFTRDEWIARMTEISPTIVYGLETPIITDLTEEEIAQYKAIVMNKGYNTIINSAGAFMEVETVCDTQLHIEQNYTPNSVTESILERLSNVETQLASNS